MAIAISLQAPAGGIERRLEAQTGECIQQRAVGGLRAAHVARGAYRYPRALGQRGSPAQSDFGRALQWTGDIDPESLRSEDAERPIEQGRREAVVTPDQRGEPRGVCFDLIPGDAALSLGTVRVAQGEQPAQIAPAAPGFDQQQE